MMSTTLVNPTASLKDVRLWLWMLVSCSIQVRGQQVPAYLPESDNVNCNQGQSPSPVVLNASMDIGAPSSITCAGICMSLKCRHYWFQAGRCYVYDLGSNALPTGDKTRTFKKMMFDKHLDNLALGKPTTSVAHWTSPSQMNSAMAVDGAEGSQNYFHSHPTVTNPWWIVDLGGTHLVKEVQVLPDGYNHINFFKTIEIRGGNQVVTDGNFAAWTLIANYAGPPKTTGQYLKFSTGNGICARYISIKRLDSSSSPYLVFNEVQVFVYPDATQV